LNNKESVSKVANDLDINTKTLYHWVRMYKKEHNIVTKDSTKVPTSIEALDEENKKLRRELKIEIQERDTFNIILMCKILKVDRASYYHWIKAGCVVKKVDIQLNKLIKSIFIQGRNNYGTRRIQDKLLELYGLIISRKRIASIMKDFNLKVKMKRRYRNIIDSNHNLPIAPNILNRDFYALNPDEKYVGDITYIQTGEGWLYLATVIDLYSRKVVGWSMDDTMK